MPMSSSSRTRALSLARPTEKTPPPTSPGDERLRDFDAWLRHGADQGYLEPRCLMHDSLFDDLEIDEIDAADYDDPCIPRYVVKSEAMMERECKTP